MARDKEKQKAYNAAYYQAHKGERKTKTSTASVNRYAAKHYKQFATKIKPELYDSIEEYTEREKISRPEFLRRSIEALNEEAKQNDHR